MLTLSCSAGSITRRSRRGRGRRGRFISVLPALLLIALAAPDSTAWSAVRRLAP